ncbi:MAG: YlxR family protein [Coriobacteriia bacterium]|nr:YlxR family protein [Coriobacteriia bacterium]
MKPTKPHLRTCLGCGRETEKRDLVRLVRGQEGEVFVDPTGKRSGRGAYVCADEACFETAVRKNRFSHALKTTIGEDDIERLRREFEDLLATDARFGSGR